MEQFSLFEQRVRQWESKMEDIIIQIASETDNNGVRYNLDTSKLIKEFNGLVNDISNLKKSKNNYVYTPGDMNNYE